VAFTVGVGATATVALVELEHPGDVEAVMEKVVVCGTFVVFVRVPEIGVPLPVAAIPVIVIVLFLDEVNVVPEIPLEVGTIRAIDDPEHIV